MPELELLHLILQLAKVHFAVGKSLFAPRDLGELAVDVVLLGDHALLDLEDRVAPLAQLRLDVGAQLHGLLARLDRRFTPRRVGLAACIVEHHPPRPPRRLEP